MSQSKWERELDERLKKSKSTGPSSRTRPREGYEEPIEELKQTAETKFDNLDRPHFNDFSTELRKIIDEKFSYNAIIKSVVIYTNEGILTLKREWRKI